MFFMIFSVSCRINIKVIMADNRILKFIDSSYKECEVTGRDMGGDYEYEIPVESLALGSVKWPQNRIPDHGVYIIEIADDCIKVEVFNVSHRCSEHFTLYRGEKKRRSYMFGEWSYGYTIWVE